MIRSPRPLRTVGLSLAMALAVSVITADSASAADDAARTVAADVAKLLTDTAQAEPAAVVQQIDAYKGPANPLLLLSRAQAHWRLYLDEAAKPTATDPKNAKGAKAGEAHLTASADDFSAALKLDATLKQAHFGLAQIAAAREDWAGAAREAGLGIDPGTAERGTLTFLANAALQAGDWRLATLASQYGIMRFSDDLQLRRVELVVLEHAGRAEDARQAALALLAKQPGDVDLWRHLAWAAQQSGRDGELLAALEAALAIRPADRTLRRQLADAQLNHGQPQAALATVRPLIGEPPAAAALADDGLMLLASRAATEGGGDAGVAQARAWLAAVPEAARSREQRLQAARLAIRAEDTVAAGAALDALVAGGESDPGLLAWAGSLAEQRNDLPRAEALYLRASASDTPSAGPATLRLAALYVKQDRRSEATTVLATYLAKKPDDAQARALQARLERKQ